MLTPARIVAGSVASRPDRWNSEASDGITCPCSTADTNALLNGKPASAWLSPAARRRRRTSRPIARARGDSGAHTKCLAILDSRMDRSLPFRRATATPGRITVTAVASSVGGHPRGSFPTTPHARSGGPALRAHVPGRRGGRVRGRQWSPVPEVIPSSSPIAGGDERTHEGPSSLGGRCDGPSVVLIR